jgi:hypothetical protein
MVALVRRGQSLRTIARRFHRALHTVQRWVARAGNERLDRVNWDDQAPIAQLIHRTDRATEDMILMLRQELKDVSDLGEYGARAIHAALSARGHDHLPAVRTIGRILERRGAFDGRRRIRRPAPPRGWYVPEVARHRAELDTFDFVQGLVIQGGFDVEVLTSTALHSGLIGAWPGPPFTARVTLDHLVTHWRQVGLPAYAQFDNDTRFQGPHHYRGVISRVMRACLSLHVVPVFTPVNEPAFQAALENLNGRWQAKVWSRFHHASYAALRERSDRYVAASRQRGTQRLESAPRRDPFPAPWQLDLQAPPRGAMIFLRRTTDRGTITMLGESFDVDVLWPHRLVRADVDLDAGCIRFYALRRRTPDDQPLLREVTYRLPTRRFTD